MFTLNGPRAHDSYTLSSSPGSSSHYAWEMGRYKGRSSVACHICHSHKVKCSGEIPCQRCRARGRECTYPARDRLLAVPESYLRTLERETTQARATSGGQAGPSDSGIDSGHRPVDNAQALHVTNDQLLEDCSPELFVRKLRELSLSTSSNACRPGPDAAPVISPSSGYTYSKLNFDFLQSDVSLKLPPRPYAFYLLHVFEEGYRDYHWHLRNRFRVRLSQTYSDPESQAMDRNWLCRVSVVLALAEAWNYGRTSPLGLENEDMPRGVRNAYAINDGNGHSASSDSTSEASSQPLPPGSALFEQALLLLKTPCEEPVLEDVEALNLIAFYSYLLNRRNMAYLYAGQSIRLATLLRLHEQQPVKEDDTNTKTDWNPVEREHRIRVWWTSYCMDIMVSTELGLPPVYQSLTKGPPLPSMNGLSREDADEFFEPQILTAQIQLCQIKSNVVDTITHQVRRQDLRPFSTVIEPCMNKLREWRENLPANMSFSFDQFPTELWDLPFGRVLASLYLRYHQCFILLLRPIFLQELSSISADRETVLGVSGHIPDRASPREDGGDLVQLKFECIRAAQCNCRILANLRDSGKIAKFGYWESLHLFSGLAILSLSRTLTFPPSPRHTPTQNRNSLNTPPRNTGDSARIDSNLYIRARALLDEMAQSGNLAARGHQKLLADVEEMVEKVLMGRNSAAGVAEDTGFLDAYSGFPAGFFDDLTNQQAWNVMDWENILSEWPG